MSQGNSSFAEYLDDLPLLHTWDNGATWNTGGFSRAHLRQLHEYLSDNVGVHPAIIETGAGNSTLTFLHLAPRRLVAIAPAADLRDRILAYCADAGIDTSALEYRVERSEIALPTLAFADERFDVALIDGGHGWPTVFVDFCYINMMMRRGGLILVDDLQIHSVAELARLLEQQPNFDLALDLGKLQIWQKQYDQPFLPEHSKQPYILSKTKRRRGA